MAKRDFRQAAEDPFGEDESGRVSESFLQADSAIFGQVAAADARSERIKTINIFTIAPDLSQPRRVVPSGVRSHWTGDPNNAADLLTVWWDAAQQERGGAFPLEGYLLGDDSAARPATAGPIETGLLAIVDLAVSVRRDGLTNPITVAPDGSGRYRLETGERRWLAFHLLYAFFDGQHPDRPDERERWEKIPARQMKATDVWRQASENTARADLNAIGKARQYALLMMNLYAEEGIRFTPYDRPADQSDRNFYAQAARFDRVPYGKRELLLNAMGAKSPAELTRCRKLLSLADEVWQLGDDYNLSQDLLLKLADMPADVALAHLKDIIRDQDPGASISQTDSRARPTLLDDVTALRGKRLFTKAKEQEIKQKVKTLFALRDGVGQAHAGTKSQIKEIVEDVRRTLDDIDRLLDDA
jgi:hypothetical protein